MLQSKTKFKFLYLAYEYSQEYTSRSSVLKSTHWALPRQRAPQCGIASGTLVFIVCTFDEWMNDDV